MKNAAPDPAQLERMRRDCDQRARKNARHYIHTVAGAGTQFFWLWFFKP